MASTVEKVLEDEKIKQNCELIPIVRLLGMRMERTLTQRPEVVKLMEPNSVNIKCVWLYLEE